jgi:hypothetical protein
MNKGELVAIAPSGALCILIPVYTRLNDDSVMDNVDGYSISIVTTPTEPVGFILDWEESGNECKVFGPGILKSLEVLGPL